MQEKKENRLEEVKRNILDKNPDTWSAEFIQNALKCLRLSLSGTREVQEKRLLALKDNPAVLEKICDKVSKKYRFSSHLERSDIPGVQAAWNSDSKQYPKVTKQMIDQFQRLKREGSKGQYRKALRMFNSRRVKAVKVVEIQGNIYVKANIYKSFTSVTNSGVTRQVFVLFKNGNPVKGYCECSIGLCGICCHVICLLLYLKHFSMYGVQYKALTCTQKIQRWHKKGKTLPKHTEMCRLPLSYMRNVRSSRKTITSSRKKKKITSKKSANIEDSIEKSDWLKRDIDEMVSKIHDGILKTSINVENHVYECLKNHKLLQSGLFLHLHYNNHYRRKQALQDHDYRKETLYDEAALQPNHLATHNTWHAPLLASIDDSTKACQATSGSHSINTDKSDQIMYNDNDVHTYVQQLENIIQIAKQYQDMNNTISCSNTKKNKKLKIKTEQKDKVQQTLSITVPFNDKVYPHGVNYHDVPQNSDEWLSLRIGKVTCSIMPYLIGLSGEKEHLHYLTCVTNKLDPNKVKPKKFKSFSRGKLFEPDAVKAFEVTTGIPITTCGFFSHPQDQRYGGSPDGLGPGFLLEIKTRVSGSEEPLSSVTASHLLQTQFQMAITGATVAFLMSYHPETKKYKTFLIEKNSLVISVVKEIIDHMIENQVLAEWSHEESSQLKSLGEKNLGKVPNFETLKHLRSWLRQEAKHIQEIVINC